MRMSRLTLVLVLLLLSVVAQPSNQSRIQGPSRDFSSHKVVRPRVYHGRSKREITSTRESDTDHTDTLSVGLELDGVARILDLRLNTDLIPVGYKERYQHQGAYKTHTAPKVELCHYQGSIRDMPGSWAAVSTCHGLKGVIYDGENLHHIQPEDEHLQASHYLYKHSDLITNHTCGYKGTSHHIADEFVAMQKASKTSRHKRATETIRGPYNANRQSRYVELVFVIDKNEYMSLGENLTRVHHHCKDIANIINALYTPLNIFIALVGVEVWTDADEITLLKDGDVTLNNFLQYRRERLVKTIPNDNAQLLTKLQFSEGVVGKALKGPICTYEFSGGVSVDHSNVVGLVAATVAHEMGHNFGMEHDSAECVCPEEKCIMAGSSGSSGPTHWSSCSLEYLALAFEHGMDYCLRNKPQRLFDSPVCGNGFVEPGEQCDCGLVENCDNPCCNASTCMLHSNASCATGECCDLKTCKPKTAGTECRSADQECDLPEYCTGQSEYCPSDVFKIDGETCNMGKAFCYQGSCRTHNDQCKLLWGPTGSSSDSLCYEMNNQGTKNGNCGFNRTGNTYIKCHDQNILCGMLHCKHLNERLEFGMESVAILSHSFLNSQGKIIACRSAIVDLGLNQVDPGLAPDGAKCAPGKMCVNQKCMPVADLRMQFPNGKACPNNCSGNGVCNSLGHCHCNRGYQPPDCTEPGVGGSQDSGPAQDPNARSEYIMSLYIIFLGIVPTLSLISFGVWYARNNGANANQWKKGSGGPISTYVSCLDCFSVNKRPKPPAKIRSKKSFLERAFSRTNANANKNVNSASLGSNNDKVYTISERLGTLPRDKIRIVKRDLVSTTNPEAISCSNEIEYRRSLCADAATVPNVVVPTPQIVNEARNPAKRASPLKTELGIKLAEHIKNLQQTNNPPQPKNFKGLTLKTDLKFEQLRESPSTSSNVTPQIIAIASASNKSSEPLLTQSKIPPTVGNKPPAFYDKKPPPPPFYDKKPPPPPAPPQSLKPKNFRKS